MFEEITSSYNPDTGSSPTPVTDMNWLIPALLSPILYTAVVLVDKYIVEKQIQNIWGLPIYTTLLGLLFGTVFWLLGGRALLPLTDAGLILLTGALTIWGSIFYFKAMTQDTSSNIVILFQMQPVIVLFLSWLLLGEVITPRQLGGFIIILTTAIVLSMPRNTNPGIRLSPAFFWVLFADLLWGLASIIFKFVAETGDFLTSAAYESWGIFIGGILAAAAFPRIRTDFRATLAHGPGFLATISANESLFVVAKLAQLFAITLGPVALVVVLGSAQIVFTMIAASILTVFAPRIFKEDLTTSHLLRRAMWVIILILGIWLVS